MTQRDDPTISVVPKELDPSAPNDRLEDEEIFCPVCGYNLTGNLTGRCSECGGLFDREMLLKAREVSFDALMPRGALLAPMR